MAKKRMYSFTEKKHSQKGITSTVLGGLSFLLLCVLVYSSFFAKGNGGIYLGTIGFTAIVMTIVGLVYGLTSFRERDVFYLFSKIGSILSGVMLAIWIFIILIGFS